MNPTQLKGRFPAGHNFPCGLIVCIGCICFAGSLARAEDAERRARELFETHVRPTFLEHCLGCHGPKKQQGGLRLDSSSWVQAGGDSGEVVVGGDPDESILMQAIRYDDPALEMPPRGKLPEATITAFEEWIALGAVDPRSDPDPTDGTSEGVVPPNVEEGRSFWSFQDVEKPAPPEVQNTQWPRTAIDRFVLAKLESQQISPAADAERLTLLRRVFYDLVGLPPTPAQIEAFMSDDSVDAYEKLLDRLLDSHQFGERWGRHWLDVVRFAQSSGGGRTLLFPDAWRYRDYVIESFNNDVPYDQFITEQIAGDQLSADDWQDRRRQLVATAFLLLGPTNFEQQDKDVLEMDVVDEQLDTIGKSLLGMTIGCARCHDHKFDPIPAVDYYAMAGILKSTKAMIHSNVSTWNTMELPVAPEEEAVIREREQVISQLQQQVAQAKQALIAAGGKPASATVPNSKSISASSIEGIVIDDSDAELTGAWKSSSSTPVYVDAGYLHDEGTAKGEKEVVYRPELEESGAYEVRVSYSAQGNRASKVPVHVHHDGGESVVYINQRKKPEINGTFTSLGVYRFSANSDVRIVISNASSDDGVVIADAVVLLATSQGVLPTPDQVDKPENIPFIVPDPKALPGIVVDDTQAVLVGQWQHSVHTPPFVGQSYIHDQKELKGEKSATFTPDLPHDGQYEVRVAHNSNVRRANHVPITIRHADGTTLVHIDEGEPAPIDKLFRSLGKFRFHAGRSGSVTIETTGTDGKYVIVDAVQFLPMQGERSNQEVEQEQQQRRKELQAKLTALETELQQAQRQVPSRPVAMVTVDDQDAGDIPLAIRGVVHNQGPIVPRGVMQVASQTPRPSIAPGESGRRELAAWIASPENPLTARVMVNRVWHWLMGRGIVKSVDNFGSMGDTPSHPELLDYLAASFVENGWSTKQLIRQIMLSRVYQLSTLDSPSGIDQDPQNTLWWRMNRKRLDAEQIRDTLLLIAGNLDTSVGGPNLDPGTKSEYGYVFQSTRRSVYVPVFRNSLPEIFEVFDFADPNIQVGKRSASTIASQALLLMNHPLVIDSMQRAAERLTAGAEQSLPALIQQAYLEVVGRPPSPSELNIAIEFLDSVVEDQKLPASSDTFPPQVIDRWAMLYQSLVQCVDFRYLD